MSAALGLAAVAVLLWPRPGVAARGRLRRLAAVALGPQGGSGFAWRPGALRRWVPRLARDVLGRVGPVPLAIVLSGAAGVVAGVHLGWMAGLAAGVAAAVLVFLVVTAVARRDERSRADGLVEAVAALAAELRSGTPPDRALRTVAGTAHRWIGGALQAGAAMAALGGDVADSLASYADLPTAQGWPSPVGDSPSSRGSPGWGRVRPPSDAAVALRRLAGAWRLCERSGCSLADVLDALEGDLRARRQQERLLRSLLAGPRATGALLAGLPALGIAMGTAIGAEPWRALTETAAGQVVLVIGVVLDAAGVAWTARIAGGARGAA